jgi:hypothetical protein
MNRIRRAKVKMAMKEDEAILVICFCYQWSGVEKVCIG